MRHCGCYRSAIAVFHHLVYAFGGCLSMRSRVEDCPFPRMKSMQFSDEKEQKSNPLPSKTTERLFKQPETTERLKKQPKQPKKKKRKNKKKKTKKTNNNNNNKKKNKNKKKRRKKNTLSVSPPPLFADQGNPATNTQH